MARMEMHAALAQAVQPGAQQRRGFHVGGEDAAGGADERGYAEAVYPLAQGFGRKGAQQRLDAIALRTVAREKDIERLGMGDVHAAFAGHQELAPHAGHRVVQVHAHACLRQHLRSHQSGGAAADDGDDGGGVQRGGEMLVHVQ